ncbi:MAG: hydroxymethylpyrimidine/phosphomethylpyrimidine kinase, partial [Gemmatimonadales bacterium]
ETVARAIARYGLSNYVLDPVMVATSGDRLLDRDAEAAIIDQLLPLASLVTPNLDEAKILTGIDIVDEKSMAAAAEQLVSRGAAAALVKGGHLGGPRMVDVLADGERTEAFGRERIGTTSTHGTGCTLSAAITAQLARGAALGKAVTTSLDFVTRAIATAPGLGAGAGPLNHFAPVSQ